MNETKKTADLTIGELVKGLTPKQLLGLIGGFLGLLVGAFSIGTQFGVNSTQQQGLTRDSEPPENQALVYREDRTGIVDPSVALSEDGMSSEEDNGHSSPEPGPLVTASKEELRYRFDLLGCSLSGRAVLCRLTLENLGDDRRIFVSKAEKGISTGTYGVRGSRIFDEQSSEHIASSIRLANQTSSGKLGIGPNAFLISGTRVPLELKFEGVSSEARSITRLFLNCRDPETDSNFTVTFESVPLSR